MFERLCTQSVRWARQTDNDWLICRRVCGENFSVAETVQAINPGYRFSTLARFREALDALVDAMKRAKQGGRELL